MIHKKIFIGILLPILCLLKAQEIPTKGMPYIRNFSPESYGNHGKIWDISAAQNGLLYGASDDGLLEFDGQNWSRFRNYKGYTRSLAVKNDSVIYVGADMDFGVWKKKANRQFAFRSLYPYRDKISKTNEEFWGTYIHGNEVVFVSHQAMYILKRDTVFRIPAPTRFSESFSVSGRIFLADQSGLYELHGRSLQLLMRYPNNKPLDISGISVQDTILFIITKNKGIFRLDNRKLSVMQMPVSQEIINSKVFCFTNIDQKYWVFGTILNGLYITDYNGKVLQHFTKNNGLLNNTVLCVYYQNNGKLWLGMDYGIAEIDSKNTISYFQNAGHNFGTGYAAALSGNTFLLGTNQGLYTTAWDKLNQNSFQLVKGSEGQVWTLNYIDGKILCGHNEGLFEVNDEAFHRISAVPGVMCLQKFDNYLFAGSYDGLYVFSKGGTSWKYIKKLQPILGAVSQIVRENKNIFWVNIPNYGFIRFSVDDNADIVTKQIFLVKKFKGQFANIYKDQKGIQVISTTNSYIFRQATSSFDALRQQNFTGVKNLYPGFWKPICINENYGFYSVNNGFALQNYGVQTQNLTFHPKLLFRTAQAFNNDQVISSLSSGEKLPYNLNNVRISYILPNTDNVEYQYFLEGMSKKWSPLSTHTKAEFLNLSEGDYTMSVKAWEKDRVIANQTFSFTIKAPWYRSFWSYVSYVILLLVFCSILWKIQKNKLSNQRKTLYKKQQEKLQQQEEKHKQELLLQKQQQLEYEKENLRNEIRNKTVELAVKAKDDEDKNRILQIISEKIADWEIRPDIAGVRLAEIKRMLKIYMKNDDRTFEIQMDELHQEFFRELKKRFPNLSVYDLRLCAFLKIGLSSKEMADILHVLPSSINVSRSRLRKKMGLEQDDDLYAFLNNLD